VGQNPLPNVGVLPNQLRIEILKDFAVLLVDFAAFDFHGRGHQAGFDGEGFMQKMNAAHLLERVQRFEHGADLGLQMFFENI